MFYVKKLNVIYLSVYYATKTLPVNTTFLTSYSIVSIGFITILSQVYFSISISTSKWNIKLLSANFGLISVT